MHSSNLQAFIAVATTASFSRAAEQLHLTQPAVSKRVASLEADLHCRLFDRIGHNIQLTEAGRALLPRAQHILAELEDCRRSIHNLSGQYRVGYRLAPATTLACIASPQYYAISLRASPMSNSICISCHPRIFHSRLLMVSWK